MLHTMDIQDNSGIIIAIIMTPKCLFELKKFEFPFVFAFLIVLFNQIPMHPNTIVILFVKQISDILLRAHGYMCGMPIA